MLIKKGAEANLYSQKWQGRKVIMKRRLPKRYRIPELEVEIRSHRTLREPLFIHRAKKAGVPTPTVYMIDTANANIVMEHVEGRQLKEVLADLSSKDRRRICVHLGELIGRLHNHGIIHGDLTTSNMILTPHNKVVFLDFGLSETSEEVEAKGTDLHLMKRALQSTHQEYAEGCFEMVMEGYTRTVGIVGAKEVSEKIEEIEKRGRYVSER